MILAAWLSLLALGIQCVGMWLTAALHPIIGTAVSISALAFQLWIVSYYHKR